MGPDVMLARASRARELATSTFSRQEIPPPSCGLSSDREKGHDLDDLSHAFLCLGGDIARYRTVQMLFSVCWLIDIPGPSRIKSLCSRFDLIFLEGII